MADSQTASDQLKVLIQGIGREAYQEGFDHALALMREMINNIQPPEPALATEPAPQQPPQRKPAGHNRKVVLRALMEIGNRGATQAGIIRKATQMGETLAQSSVRHVLKQLHGEGRVRQSGRRWRLVPQEGETAGTTSQAGPAASANSSQGGL